MYLALSGTCAPRKLKYNRLNISVRRFLFIGGSSDKSSDFCFNPGRVQSDSPGVSESHSLAFRCAELVAKLLGSCRSSLPHTLSLPLQPSSTLQRFQLFNLCEVKTYKGYHLQLQYHIVYDEFFYNLYEVKTYKRYHLHYNTASSTTNFHQVSSSPFRLVVPFRGAELRHDVPRHLTTLPPCGTSSRCSSPLLCLPFFGSLLPAPCLTPPGTQPAQ